eukprot:CAMPEP_0196571156 /NCGR_PEP_ID=MMETSP1081-20130531/1321_1 /TAXON_ID=36882 /ORGANISM="Pyramimonas amylifera, Strain CCMP720" /LENGTH=219 /DNA_ID=CAMNT_0041887969 /DNA_START=79 /DNA_END=738 /DNA_ORIENTATION=-
MAHISSFNVSNLVASPKLNKNLRNRMNVCHVVASHNGSEQLSANLRLNRRETMLAATVIALSQVGGKPAQAGLMGPYPGEVPTDIGIQAGGGLKACPKTPNCRSSSSPTSDDKHYTAPLSFSKPTPQAIADVTSIINNYPLDLGFDGKGARLVSATDNYVYANMTSKRFGFVDDVEFLFDNGKMMIRTASRLGESDGGVNTNRVEFFKAELLKAGGWSQ